MPQVIEELNISPKESNDKTTSSGSRPAESNGAGRVSPNVTSEQVNSTEAKPVSPDTTASSGSKTLPLDGKISPPSPQADKRSIGKKVTDLIHNHPLALMIAAVLLVIATVFGLHYYLYAASHETTDDAFIDGHIVPISPNIVGHVVKLYVNDNQPVKQGDLLAEIDPDDYKNRLDQAKAALQASISKQQAASSGVELTKSNTSGNVEQATAGVTAAQSAVNTARAQAAAQSSHVEEAHTQLVVLQANIDQAKADIVAAQAEARRTEIERERYQQLFKTGDVSHQQLDDAIAAAETASARLESAQKKVAATSAQLQAAHSTEQAAIENARQAQSQVAEMQAKVAQAHGQLASAQGAPQQVAVSKAQSEEANAEIEQARAAVAKAELELSYTKIYAPESGLITHKSIESGAYVQVGQMMMAIVPNDLWVTANFKETQLTNMRPGAPVEIKIDAYPGKSLKGHVDSIQKGAGARFSLLPPENATGNYIKVVQRVPVKIVFDEAPDPNYPIGPGMSAEPEVLVK